MSYVPMASHGTLAGLGFLGCNGKSARNSPQSRNSLNSIVPKPLQLEPSQEYALPTDVRESQSISECPTSSGNNGHALHRVRQVREQQGISVRSMAKRLGIDVKQYKSLEDPSRDLKLSELSVIQKALEVPLVDLLEDRNSMARPVEERAKLVKVMKTAVAIRESNPSLRTARLATMLSEQLIDLMPELKEVGGWPQFGARRGQAALGKALCEPIDISKISDQD